ncbi:hypothetical protein B0H14DRAFT_3424241 [Mycena olivaceomarginata]|nr:hypothetical protein B0H14DRAFT_3424241 [Mycena olivaceomarginata]
MRHCKCEKSDDAENLEQLMRNQWYPATVTDPGTPASFDASLTRIELGGITRRAQTFVPIFGVPVRYVSGRTQIPSRSFAIPRATQHVVWATAVDASHGIESPRASTQYIDFPPPLHKVPSPDTMYGHPLLAPNFSSRFAGPRVSIKFDFPAEIYPYRQAAEIFLVAHRHYN